MQYPVHNYDMGYPRCSLTDHIEAIGLLYIAAEDRGMRPFEIALH